MPNKQIQDYDDKGTPSGSDKILIQDSLGVTQYILRESLHREKVGWFNYDDAATASSPITHNGSEGFKKLTNDTLGAQNDITYRPTSMTTLWNPATNQLDFSELSVGDMVDLRVHVEVTTTIPNQEVVLLIDVGVGTASNFQLELNRNIYKSAGAQPITRYIGGSIGSELVRTGPAELKLDTDGSASIRVFGWYAKVTRR